MPISHNPKAIFFRDSLRFVDYNKCEGCLKCVDVCEHNAIEVISIEQGNLTEFKIDHEKCTVCKKCLEPGFCFQNLFKSIINPDTGETIIRFIKEQMNLCESCLKCFSNCPNNAIIPVIVQ